MKYVMIGTATFAVSFVVTLGVILAPVRKSVIEADGLAMWAMWKPFRRG